MAMNQKLLRPKASGFNPKQISGLALWMDASDTTTLTFNGGDVSAWSDKSGTSSLSASQASAAFQPLYNATGAGGKGCIEFTASDSLAFGSSTASFNYLHNATGATMFCVVKPATTSDPNAIIYFLNNANNSSGNTGVGINFDDRASVTRNNVFLAQINRGVGGLLTSTVVSENSFISAMNAYSVLTLSLDNANATAANRSLIYSNGTLTTSVNTVTNAAATGNASFNMSIGNFGGNGAVAGVAEFIFYQGILSASQRNSVHGYLAKKYGITVA